MKSLFSLIISIFLVQNLYSQTPFIDEKEKVMQPVLWLGIWDAENSQSFKIDSIGFGELPQEIEYRGVPVEIVRWRDTLGSNILLLTQTGAFNNKNSSGEISEVINDKAEINAFHFINSGNGFKRQWKLYDFIECDGVDMYAGFLPHSLTITDIDNDGVAEVTFLYKLVCRGDASPAEQKLIMYEGSDKYALRGETRICLGELNEYYGGSFKADEKLLNKSDFYNFAKKRWELFKCDDWKSFN